MKKFIVISTILFLVITQLFAITKNTNNLTNNNIINQDSLPNNNNTFSGNSIATTLYYGDSTNLELNQDNLTSNLSKITKPFCLKANGNVSTVTTIYVGISSEYFHNSITSSNIKPEVYIIENTENTNYKSIGEYTSIENDPTVSNSVEYHSIVRDETNTDKGQTLKSKHPQLDTIFSVTLPQANHNNDTVLVFAFTWDAQTYLFTGDYTSSITVSYFSDL